MARRSDHSREELAALVIAAAQSLAEQHGAPGVTMREIAARIGYAPGSIYNAVGDLDAVLLRVNAATLERLAQCLAPLIEAPPAGPMQPALAIADAYVAFVLANPRLWATLLERRPPAAAPEWYAAARLRLVEIVSQAVAPFYPDPAARRRAVIALWAALQGVASLAAGGNLAFAVSATETGDIARSIVRRYLTGHERDPGAGSDPGCPNQPSTTP